MRAAWPVLCQEIELDAESSLRNVGRASRLHAALLSSPRPERSIEGERCDKPADEVPVQLDARHREPSRCPSAPLPVSLRIWIRCPTAASLPSRLIGGAGARAYACRRRRNDVSALCERDRGANAVRTGRPGAWVGSASVQALDCAVFRRVWRGPDASSQVPRGGRGHRRGRREKFDPLHENDAL